MFIDNHFVEGYLYTMVMNVHCLQTRSRLLGVKRAQCSSLKSRRGKTVVNVHH